MITAAYSLVYTRWYTSNMSNAILPHTFGSIRSWWYAGNYCYDLRPIHDQEVLRTGGMERNEVRPPVPHVVVYIPCSKKYNKV